MPPAQAQQIVSAFFATPAMGKIPVFVPAGSSGRLLRASVNTAQGTFLAKSSSRRARAVAAIMAMHDAHEAVAKSGTIH